MPPGERPTDIGEELPSPQLYLSPEVAMYTPADIIHRVAAYYGLPTAELSGESQHITRTEPRNMALYLMTKALGCTFGDAANIMNLPDSSKQRTALNEFEIRLATSPFMELSSQDIIDSSPEETQPKSKQVIDNVCKFYDVAATELEPTTVPHRILRVRKMAQYILLEYVGCEVWEVMLRLKRSREDVVRTNRLFKKNLPNLPYACHEVDYLLAVEQVDQSLNQRFIDLLSNVTLIEPASILMPTDEEATKVRDLALTAMVERGHSDEHTLSKLFNINNQSKVSDIVKQTKLRLLMDNAQQQLMDWLQQAVTKTDVTALPPLSYDAPLANSDHLPLFPADVIEPGLRDQIYDTISRAARWYGVSLQDVVSQSTGFEAVRARTAVALLCDSAGLPAKSVALCMGGRTAQTWARTVNRAKQNLDGSGALAADLEAIKVGAERLEDSSTEIKLRVLDIFQLDEVEFKTSGSKRAERARAVFMTVMNQLEKASARQMAEMFDQAKVTVNGIIWRTNQRMANEPRLLAEINYVADPVNCPRPISAQELIASICWHHNVELELVRQPKPGSQESMVRRLIAFLLADSLDMSSFNIAELLQTKKGLVEGYARSVRDQLVYDSALADQVKFWQLAISRYQAGN